MAKCYSCGKVFDYEKFYGICPKCGAYNKETTSVEEHKELHQQYDASEPEWNHYEDTREEDYSWSDSTYNYEDGLKEQTGNRSTVGIVVCVLLILGIIGTIIALFVFVAGNAYRMTTSVIDEEEFIIEYDENVQEYNPPQIVMEAEFIETGVGEDIYFITNKGSSISVEGAKVVVPANQVKKFPANEKLVAISVSYRNDEQDYYLAGGMMYAGYGNGVYKQLLDGYYFEEFKEILTEIKLLETVDLYYSTGCGEFLVFVPEDITEIKVYIESEDVNNEQILEVYYVPLEIQEGGTYE